ncbi:MAG TPA: o-succinylbenzoate--CoA ligase [Solirubrobacterales bacterium]|nr:o-succinylbenzoate--CoA ligase [Solirubrobacterales bacterium]
MKLDNWLAQRSQSCPDRIALIADGESMTYSQLEDESAQAARRLAAWGVRRGATVAMNMRPGRDKIILIHALMKTGAVLLPISPKLSSEERARAIESCGVSVDLDDPGKLTQTEADLPLLGEHDMSDPHCRILTSGSTGMPHTVSLSYGNHLFSAMGSAFNIGVDPSDRWLCALPTSHISGLSIVMRSVIYGTAMVLQDRFEPSAITQAIEEDGVTVISLVSTMLLRLLNDGVDLSAPRAILVGGGPVPQSALREALDRGARVIQTYGLTETCSQVTTLEVAEARRKVGSVGRPLLTSHLRIQGGEILVQGPTVSAGALDADGWLHTGDVGRIDEDGFLYVQGRTDEMIISGGENVIPGEVEDVLLQHPGILEAAVIGRPDPEWQQAVTAVVVTANDAQIGLDELRGHCEGKLAPYKIPKRIEVVGELPKTPSGKLHRAALLKQEA